MGGARRGSQRTPLRPGGGVTFGPKPRDWSIDMNKKERRLALATAIQSAAPDVIVVEDFASSWEEIKTASLVSKLSALGSNPMEQKTLLVLNNISENVLLSGRNVEKLAINEANALQVYDILNASKIVVEKSALAYIQEFYGPRSDEE
jgi:large subunit ribosomal protein L4